MRWTHRPRAALGVVALVAAAMAPTVPGAAMRSAQAPILVEVLNGTGRAGLARVGTRVLRQRGFDVVYFGNADSALRGDSTLVIVRRGDSTAAKRVRDALGGGRLVARPDPSRRLDVTVVLGSDWQPVLPLHP